MFNINHWVSNYNKTRKKKKGYQSVDNNNNNNDNEPSYSSTSIEEEDHPPPLLPELVPGLPSFHPPLEIHDDVKAVNSPADGGKPEERTNWAIIKRRVPYYVSVLSWLPSYDKGNLFHDVIAGLSVAVMLIPQALSYASIVGLPSVYGLYAGCLPIAIYALFGQSKQLCVGPEALSSMLVGASLETMIDNSENYTKDDTATLAIILSFLAGTFMFLLGLFRFGFLSEVLSRPLLRGFTIAVALTIIVEQLDVLLGLSLANSKTWHKIPAIIKHYHEIQGVAAALGIGTVIFLFSFQFLKKKLPDNNDNVGLRIFQRIPGILIAVLICTILTGVLRFDKKGLPILGNSPKGLPSPVLPRLDYMGAVGDLISPAIIISIVGFVETMAVGKYYSTKYNYQVSANRELVALGMANLVGSFFQAWPIFGSLARSAANDKSGGRTQLSGMVTAFFIALTLLFLLPWFYFLPRAVMSGIIVVAAAALVEVHDILFLWRVRAWGELILLTATCLITFIYGAEVGILLSVGASIFLVIKKTSVPHISILGKLPNTTKYKDIRRFHEAEPQPGVIALRIEESLHYANIGQFKEMLFRLESVGSFKAHPADPMAPPIRAIILDVRALPEIDASSLQIFYEMMEQYKKRNVRVSFVRLRDAHKTTFLRAGILQVVGTENIFHSVHEAVEEINAASSRRTFSTYYHHVS